MGLTSENGTDMVMPVSPMNSYFGGGGGFDNGNGWWIILLFILLASGNWGGYGNGGFAGENGTVQRGFDQASVMGGVNGIQAGVQGLSTQLCNCCADMAQTVNSGFANAETAANARQMANMQQGFGIQTAITNGLTNLSSQFADCLKKIIEKAKDNLIFTKYTVGSCAA